MKWEKVKLGKYVEILSGFAFKSKMCSTSAAAKQSAE